MQYNTIVSMLLSLALIANALPLSTDNGVSLHKRSVPSRSIGISGPSLRQEDDGDNGVAVAVGFRLKSRNEDADDGVVVADGFKLKTRDDDDDDDDDDDKDGVVVADGFKLRVRNTDTVDSVDVADGFKLMPRSAQDGNHIRMADGI